MTDAPAENQPDPDPAADDSDAGRSTPTPRPDPPLRPVDWDGSFSRTSNARLADQIGDEVAAQQEAEWDEKLIERITRDSLDTLLAEKEVGGRDASAGQPQEPDHSTDSRSTDTRRQTLFDKLEGFGRHTDVEPDEAG